MKHAAVLDLRVMHSFFADGCCREVALLPSPETVALLRMHRCLTRCEPGRAQVLVAAQESEESESPLPAGTVLQFTLEVRGDLSQMTDMSALDSMWAPLFTNRDTGAQALSLVEAPAPTRRRPGVLAAVEVVLPVAAAEQAPVLMVVLTAKRAYWAYYCVTNLHAGPDGLHIVDRGEPAREEPAIRFGEAGTKTFDAATPAEVLTADPLAWLLVKQNPALRCVRFLSDEPVELRQEPRRGIELHLGPDPVLRPLPNPAPHSAAALTLTGDDGSTRVVEAHAHLLRYIAKAPAAPA